jgi:hypothetical protein
MISGVQRRWTRFWYGGIDPIRLVAFRWAFTWSLLFYVVTWLRHGHEWLTPAGFHPSRSASPMYAPRVPLLPEAVLWPFALVLCGAGLAIALRPAHGRFLRIFTALVLAGVIYVTLADPISAFTLNRLFIVGFAVLLLAPRPAGEPARQIAWPVRVLQLTLLLQYLGAGVCKAVSGDWLDRSDVLWTQVQGVFMTDLAATLVRWLPTWGWTAIQHLALGFELVAPLLFAIRRLRPLAFVLGLGMHLIIALTMAKLIWFSLQMACFYLLFVDPRHLRTLARRLRGVGSSTPRGRAPEHQAGSAKKASMASRSATEGRSETS